MMISINGQYTALKEHDKNYRARFANPKLLKSTTNIDQHGWNVFREATLESIWKSCSKERPGTMERWLPREFPGGMQMKEKK